MTWKDELRERRNEILGSPPIDRFDGEYRWLSNFAFAEVLLDGAAYGSVEHAFQAAKVMDPVERQRFNGCTAAQAKKLGRRCRLRPDWEQVKVTVMTDLVRQKFDPRRYPDLARKLLETHPRELVEGNTWGDTYWGVCAGQGENRLGQLLMQVRNELRAGHRPQPSAEGTTEP